MVKPNKSWLGGRSVRSYLGVRLLSKNYFRRSLRWRYSLARRRHGWTWSITVSGLKLRSNVEDRGCTGYGRVPHSSYRSALVPDSRLLVAERMGYYYYDKISFLTRSTKRCGEHCGRNWRVLWRSQWTQLILSKTFQILKKLLKTFENLKKSEKEIFDSTFKKSFQTRHRHTWRLGPCFVVRWITICSRFYNVPWDNIQFVLGMCSPTIRLKDKCSNMS
jgi:hypothetical protein